MEFRQLTKDDVYSLCDLVTDMYANLNNLELITPIFCDRLHLLNMLCMSRYYFLGAFEKDELIGVTSLDFQKDDYLKKIKIPEDYNLDNMVEVSYTMVRSKNRGKGVMKSMLNELTKVALEKGYEQIFSETHKYNFPSVYGFKHSGYDIICNFQKDIDLEDFKFIASQDCLSQDAKKLAEMTLVRFQNRTVMSLPYIIVSKSIKPE